MSGAPEAVRAGVHGRPAARRGAGGRACPEPVEGAWARALIVAAATTPNRSQETVAFTEHPTPEHSSEVVRGRRASLFRVDAVQFCDITCA